MRTNHRLLVLLTTTVFVVFGAVAADNTDKTGFPSDKTSSALCEGVWVWRSGHHLPSREIQKIVKITKSNAQWQIAQFTLSHTRESFREKRPPQIKTEGPYPVSVTNGVLHIQHPDGVFKHSCRFYGDLLQFPAIVRTEEKTLGFTFSRVGAQSDSEAKGGVDTWDYMWTCSSDPSQAPNGKASLLTTTPRGKNTIACVYTVEKHDDGPALVFRPAQGTPKAVDRIVWHRKYFGPQIYDSLSPELEGAQCPQRTYSPAPENLKKLVDAETDEEPNKPDAGDGK